MKVKNIEPWGDPKPYPFKGPGWGNEPSSDDNPEKFKLDVIDYALTTKVGLQLHQANGFTCIVEAINRDEETCPGDQVDPGLAALIVRCVASYPHPIYSHLWTARDSWDEYFMGIAKQVSTRATCDRRHVGAVLVKNKNIISTGYNGSVRGTPHCTSEKAGHMMIYDSGQKRHRCVRTVHAEANAVCQAAKNGAATDGCTLYTSASPCFECYKLVANAGIVRIVYQDEYPDSRFIEESNVADIQLERLT